MARTKTNISRNNKQRGRSFQQEIMDAILEAFPSLEPDDVRSVSMGAGGEDVQLSPAARKMLPIQIECKRVKSAIGSYKWLSQAKAHGSYTPTVFFRADREPALVMLPAADYIAAMKELYELRIQHGISA